MKQLYNKNFHTVREIEPSPENKELYVLESWKPEQAVYLVGCQIRLLCSKSDAFELYLSVSRSDSLEPKEQFVGLKRDYLFYAQRDVYDFSTSPDDLTKELFLPSDSGFLVKKDEPIYIKVGAVNKDTRKLKYDAFCNLYYANPQ